jgi:hypothetical protein
MLGGSQRITEYDVVALKRSLRTWPAGTQTAVLSDYGPAKLIEVSDDEGQELDMFVDSEEDLELVEHN